MTGCRIGKVTLKDRKLHLLQVKDRPYVHRAVENLSSYIGEDAIAVEFFIVRKNRAVATGWSYEAGTSNADFLGGCDVLRTEWIRREMA